MIGVFESELADHHVPQFNRSEQAPRPNAYPITSGIISTYPRLPRVPRRRCPTELKVHIPKPDRSFERHECLGLLT
jgi:hypothetical protein